MKPLFVFGLIAVLGGGVQAADVVTVTGTKNAGNVSADSLLANARKAKGLAGVTENPRLTKAAKMQTSDMIAMKKLTHEGPNGSNVRDRIKAQGYKGCVFVENIAHTGGDVQSVFDLWMNSKPHKANIENPKTTEYGISNSQGYWTLVLSGPC